MNKRKAGLFSLGLFTIVAILHFIHFEKWATIPAEVLITSRWIFIASLLFFSVYKIDEFPNLPFNNLSLKE